MARINLSEINQYIKNFFDRIGLRDLEKEHAERIKQWLIENLSNIGRYSVRDFERTGNLNSFGKHPYNDMRPVHHDRADGWVSLTEEVPDIDHLTYGTGMLYVHGEMELPEYWKEQGGKPGDHMYNDEFHQVNYSGTQKYLYQQVGNGGLSGGAPVYIPNFWYEPEFGDDDVRVPGRTPPTTAAGLSPGWGDQDWMFGYLWEEEVAVPAQIVNGTFKEPNGTVPLYSDQVAWFYGTITYTIGGDQVRERQGDAADGDNDDLVYHLDNERNNYPWRVVNGATAKSVKTMLEEVIKEKSNGMYDESLPALAEDVGTYAPLEGLKFVKDKIDGIVNFISPVDEVPTGASDGKSSQQYKDAFFARTGIDVDDPSTWPDDDGGG